MAEVLEVDIIEQTTEFVKQTLYHDTSGHDWWHVFRVWKIAREIQSQNNSADYLVVELSALLHDIADWKSNKNDFTIGSDVARKWLSSLGTIKDDQVDHICFNIENISFVGIDQPKKALLSLEGQIVQDADRIDAMGAIGIARTFAYGGNIGRPIHEPSIEQINNHSFSYLQNHNNSTSINHFYEKLLLIKDLMNTKQGKFIAEKRHKFMLNYLKQFFGEWEGEI